MGTCDLEALLLKTFSHPLRMLLETIHLMLLQKARPEEWAAQSTELVGKWSVVSSGFSAFIYAFGADGTYEHSGTMESSLANAKIVLFESGTFSVQGDVLTLYRSSGTLMQNSQKEQLGPETETYRWRMSLDFYTSGRVLWLMDSSGQGQQFYASD
jgi:hypothetical protein